MKTLIPLFPLLLLAACGQGGEDSGGVSAAENKALDEAADKVERDQAAALANPSPQSN